MAAILNSAMLDSAILHKTLTQTRSILTQTHLFWLNLMISAILNSALLDSDTAILDSNTLLSSLRLTQKHSHSILNLTQTNSIWLKLIYLTELDDGSHLESSILDSAIYIKLWLKLVQSDSNSFILTQLDDISHLEFCHLGFRQCHLGFKHLVIFSQIHSKTLFLHSEPDSN